LLTQLKEASQKVRIRKDSTWDVPELKLTLVVSMGIDQLKRTPEELVSFVFRECSSPYGCFVMTRTGIVPENDFTLKSGGEVSITIDIFLPR
jgi:fumarylacetoacetate (FAA) hydrolase family protein